MNQPPLSWEKTRRQYLVTQTLAALDAFFNVISQILPDTFLVKVQVITKKACVFMKVTLGLYL